MRMLRPVLALVVVASTLLVAVPTANAAGSIDQAQTSVTGGCLVLDASYGATQWFQTFTAGRAGTLDQVDYFLGRGAAADPTPFTLEVRAVGSDGNPTEAVLTSGTVAATKVPVSGSEAWVPFPVAPIPSVVGQQYAIVVSRGAAAWSFCGDAGDAYTGGHGGARGRLADDSGWDAWTDLDAPNNDWAFRTRVDGGNPLQGTVDGVNAVVSQLMCSLQALLGGPCA